MQMLIKAYLFTIMILKYSECLSPLVTMTKKGRKFFHTLAIQNEAQNSQITNKVCIWT